MITAAWSEPLPSFLWQVALHASIMGLIFYVWAHHVNLPSGLTKRRLLTLLLLLPLVTAAIPGRTSLEFGERFAWLNSARVLSLPLLAGFRVYHVALLVGVLAVALTVWQELLPMLRVTRTTADGVPDTLLDMVRGLPGWDRCRVALSPMDPIMLATGGWPGRPKLIVSRGALEALSESELAIVIAHEHAHWRAGRWLRAHLLFLVRLLQCYSPVALWVFREYCVELEIGCDAQAVAGRDPNQLVRVLLRIYQATDRRDVAARGALRKRVDVLLAGGPNDAALPTGTVVAATVLMVVVLPWIV